MGILLLLLIAVAPVAFVAGFDDPPATYASCPTGPPGCEEFNLGIECKWGYRLGSGGSCLCECARNPCLAQACPAGATCSVRERGGAYWGECSKVSKSMGGRTVVSKPNRPNILLLLADDMGYGDLLSYGNTQQEFNRIDQMAAEGMRFRNFYSGDSLCTPSRASLNTGRLPLRIGHYGADRVLWNTDQYGLPTTEMTIAEALQGLGYHTGMIGKWHLGINRYNRTDGTHLPHHHGYNFVGTILPYSDVWSCDESYEYEKSGPSTGECFIYWRDKLIQQPIKLNEITRRLVLDWYTFFNNWLATKTTTNEDRPFFFYFGFPQVHTAFWHTTILKQFSRRGLFGDSLNEMAWGIEQVLDSLAGSGEDKNTFTVFTADHGPHKEVCTFGGETAGLKGGKSNFWEGAYRVPGIVWMPGTVPAGYISETIITHLDFMPTFVSLGLGPGQENPLDQFNITHDGIDMAEYLLGQKIDPLHEITEKRPIFYYCATKLMAIRYKQYKIHFQTPPLFPTSDDDLAQCPGGIPTKDWFVSSTCPDEDLTWHDPPLVYDLDRDIFESFNISPTDNPDIQTMLDHVQTLIAKHNSTIVVAPPFHGIRSDDVLPCGEGGLGDFPDNCIMNYP